jgi:hypothetical protein
MAIVNAELYDFLKECETGLTTDRNRNVIAYVFIDFDKIQEFIKIVGTWFLEDGGYECMLKDGCIRLDLNEIIDGEGHKLSDYEKCFYEDDWRHYKDMILDMEKE